MFVEMKNDEEIKKHNIYLYCACEPQNATSAYL